MSRSKATKKTKPFTLLFLAVLAILILAGLYLRYASKNEVATSIAFYHNGIDQGLDPNGNKFDIYEIRDVEVVSEAIGNMEAGSELDAETISKAVTVNPVMPKNILEDMKSIKENENMKTDAITGDGYHPNEYRIGLKKVKGLSNAQHEEILSEILSVYTQNYYDKYFVVQPDLFSLTEENLMSYDYPEMVDALSHEIFILTNYIHSFKQEDAFFRGTESRTSFGDLEQRVFLLRSVNLGKLDSYIGAYKFTKEEDKRIELLSYRIKVEENSSQRNIDKKAVLQSIIDKFKKDTALMFMGAEMAPIELENKSAYYNEIISRYTQASVASSVSRRNIEKMNKEIADLEAMTIPYDLYKEIKEEIDFMAIDLLNRIGGCKEETYALINDYYEKEFFGKMVEQVSEIEWR